jgi:hypothetical protein
MTNTPTPATPDPTPATPAGAPNQSVTLDVVADTHQYNTVGWEGTDGLWRVQTRLIGQPANRADKEIDIDDREARVLVSIEMSSEGDWDWKATKFKAVLEVDETSPNENISIDDTNSGPLVLFDHVRPDDPSEVFPGVALQKIIDVKTGLFSSVDLNRQSASPGTKNYVVKLSYDLEPIVGSTRQTLDTKLVFYIASD